MWYVLIFKTQNGRGGCVDPTGARARSRASRYYLRMHKKEMKSHTNNIMHIRARSYLIEMQ